MDGLPVFSDHGIVCVAGAFKDKVKVTFYEGACLPDPDKVCNSGLRASNGARLTCMRAIRSTRERSRPSFGQPWTITGPSRSRRRGRKPQR